MAKIDVTIDDLMIKKYLYAINLNSFYSRYIFKISDIKRVGHVDKCDEYIVTTADGMRLKLLEDTTSGKINLYMPDIGKMLAVQAATNDFVTLLKEGDTIVYNQPNAPPVEARVDKYQEKYKRFLLIVFGTRHNLTTVLKRYGQANITSIITADMRKEMHAAHT